jgi:hypothetical protein
MTPQKQPLVRPAVLHICPICHNPQTKIQRRLGAGTSGSIVYVCARAEQCSIGMDLRKVETWQAV